MPRKGRRTDEQSHTQREILFKGKRHISQEIGMLHVSRSMFKGVNNKLSISDHLELLCMVCMGEKHEQMLGDIACNYNRGLISAVHITVIKFCRLGV